MLEEGGWRMAGTSGGRREEGRVCGRVQPGGEEGARQTQWDGSEEGCEGSRQRAGHFGEVCDQLQSALGLASPSHTRTCFKSTSHF
eukprot:2266514-Rhodomonas_salina.3